MNRFNLARSILLKNSLFRNRLPLGVIFILCLSATNSSSESREETQKAYDYLKERWSYFDVNGNQIYITRLGRGSKGDDFYITANGKRLNLIDLYDAQARGVINPTRKANFTPVELKGDEPGVLKGITELHNQVRRKIGLGLSDLVWDEQLARYAQEWADHLRDTNSCRMQHRTGKFDTNGLGENLAAAVGKKMEPSLVLKYWADEVSLYHYATNTCRGVCGHYTQIVWRNTKRVGCGVASCGKSEVWVCNYDPPGNYKGKKPY